MAIPNKEVLEILSIPPQNIKRIMKSVGVNENESFLKGRNRYFYPSGVKKLLGYRGFEFKKRQIITFSNLKGGVGKTTVALSVAHRLKALGAKVLLIDLDKQANCTTNLTEAIPKFVACDLVEGKCKNVHDAIIRIEDGLDLIPSSLLNSQVESEVIKKNQRGKNFSFDSILSKVPEYDFIIFDTEPSLSLTNNLAIESSTKLIIPITLDRFSIEGLQMTLETASNLLEKPGVKFDISVLINKFDGRIKSSLDYLSTLNELGVDVLKSVIRTDTSFQKAQGSSTPLISGNGYTDISGLTNEIIGIHQETSRIQ